MLKSKINLSETNIKGVMKMQLCDIKPFVRFAAKTSYLPNKDFTMAYDNRILYVIRGSGVFRLEDREYNISEGSLVLFPCGIKYHPKTSLDSPLYFVTINFDYTQNNSDKAMLMPPVPPEEFREEKIVERAVFSDVPAFGETVVLEGMQIAEKYLFDIVDEFAGKKNRSNEISSGLMAVVLGIIARYSSANIKTFDKVNLVLNYIRENYNKNINNLDIAKAFNYHPYYINRLVKMQTGVSLHKYIMEFRITMALKMLMATDMSVAEIAFETGFKNPDHFSVCFKKKTGKTPSYYRHRGNL